MTPKEAAAYLSVHRRTVYRYIRRGKLMASRVGRGYRIPRGGLDSLLWATRAGRRFKPREYAAEEIAEFIRDDRLDRRARAVAERFSAIMDDRTPRDQDVDGADAR
jgi:excisionase family DNA binding protein